MEKELEYKSNGIVVERLRPEVREVEGEFGSDYLILREDERLVTLESLYDRPRRIDQQVKFSDVQGFIDYVNVYKLPETVLFPSPNSICSVIDYHTKDIPSRCEHTASFNLAHTVEWKSWKSAAGAWMDQRAFANFLETNLKSITEPSGGTILGLVRQFKAVKNGSYVSELDDGGNEAVIQFKTVATATSGDNVTFPQEIKVALRCYEGTERFDNEVTPHVFEFRVAIRWKIGSDNTGVKFTIEILGIEQGQREAFDNLVSEVTKQLKVPTFLGASIS